MAKDEYMEDPEQIEGSIEASIITPEGQQTTVLFNASTTAAEIAAATTSAVTVTLKPEHLDIVERTVEYGRSFWSRAINVSFVAKIPFLGTEIQFTCSRNPDSVKETIIKKGNKP